MDDDRFYEPALARFRQHALDRGLAVALEHCPDAVAAAFALVIRQRAILGVCTDPAIEPFVLDPAR